MNLFIAPFVPSPMPVVQHMLELAELKPGEVFFDLGRRRWTNRDYGSENFWRPSRLASRCGKIWRNGP